MNYGIHHIKITAFNERTIERFTEIGELIKKNRASARETRFFLAIPNLFRLFFAVIHRFTVVRAQVQFLNFRNEWVTGVTACALIVKRVFGHHIHLFQERFFINIQIFNPARDIQRIFQFLNGVNQAFDFFVDLIGFQPRRQPQEVREFRVASFDKRILVLRENPLFNRFFRCVVFHHVRQQQRIGQPVRHMEAGAQFMRHRVAKP